MKRINIIFACVLLAAFLLGLDGLTVAGADAEYSNEDHLIGVFVTSEPLDLFDFDSYAQDNIGTLLSGGEVSAEDAEQYQGKLYAAETTSDGQTKYTFDGIMEGFELFCPRFEDEHGEYTGTVGCEEISGTKFDIKDTDEGTSLDIAGTIYVKNGNMSHFYFNPVYQDSQGRVYAATGSGFSANGTGSFSQNLNQSVTCTDTDGNTSSYTATVETSVQFMDVPLSQTVIFMDGDARELRRLEPEVTETGDLSEIDASGASFILLETVSTDEDGGEVTSYALYQPEDTYLQVFYARSDGICIMRDISISW